VDWCEEGAGRKHTTSASEEASKGEALLQHTLQSGGMREKREMQKVASQEEPVSLFLPFVVPYYFVLYFTRLRVSLAVISSRRGGWT